MHFLTNEAPVPVRALIVLLITLGISLLLLSCGKHAGKDGTNGNTTTIIQEVPHTPDVIVVKLCEGFTPSYPNIFPEYALCINNGLIGVYSQNGGFLAELPPGTYSSNGINSSCILTIKPNCVIETH